MNVTMKGCFISPTECNNTECIDTTTDMKKNLNYCCCRGSMCNKEQRWVPVATKAPKVIHSPEKESKMPLIVAIALISMLIGLFLLTFCYVKHQKDPMFNEIPTVSSLGGLLVCACAYAALPSLDLCLRRLNRTSRTRRPTSRCGRSI